MRVSFMCLVLLVAATVVASTNAVQVNNAAADSNPSTGRYLKGSKKLVEEDEERGIPSYAQLKAFFQKLPNKIGGKHLKWVQTYRARHPEFRKANM